MPDMSDNDQPRYRDHDWLTRLFWRLNRWYARAWHGLQTRGVDNIPSHGPVILASNHTTGIDPCLIQAACPRVIRWVMLTSYHFAILKPLWRVTRPIALERISQDDTKDGADAPPPIPDEPGVGFPQRKSGVREGGGDLTKIRQLVRILKAGDIIGLFPEGGLQRTHRELQPFEPGIGLIARRGGAVIVPVWIAGTPQRRNMLWHFLQPSRSTVTFGQPFAPDKSQSDEQIVEELRRRMLELAQHCAKHE